MWFKEFDFKEDPYTTLGPFSIPLDYIKWNRDDLADKSKLERFIEDVGHGYRAGLAVYGPAGSGKTWLLRYLQKRLVEKFGGDIAVIYGRILRLEPTFGALYDDLVQSWNDQRDRILEAIDTKVGRTMPEWREFIGDSDLARCLYQIRSQETEQKVRICEHWLRGRKIGSADLREVEISLSLDRDYQRYLVLRKLLELSLWALGTCVVVVDELENAVPPRFAAALGDSLRDLLDSFAERFGLVCSYSAQAVDELLDWGFGEFLFTRLESHVRLDPITPDSAPAIFKVHHAAYRGEEYTGDPLFPFTEGGLRRLINRMDEARWYPRFILQNCGVLGRAAVEQGIDLIDEDFVDKQASDRPQDFQYLAPTPRLM